MDEDMQFIQEVLQPSWGGTCKRGGGQPEHGGAFLHFSFQSLPPLQRWEEQEQIRMVGRPFEFMNITFKSP